MVCLDYIMMPKQENHKASFNGICFSSVCFFSGENAVNTFGWYAKLNELKYNNNLFVEWNIAQHLENI